MLEALQNGCVPGRLVALGYPGCEHVFKVIHDLPVPSRAALINAAVKRRFSQSKLPFLGGSAPGGATTPYKTASCIDNCLVGTKQSVW